MIDYIVLILIGLAAAFGLIRGIVSQVMALLGIVAAYFLAPGWGRTLGGAVQEQLGSSRFMADKASILLVGILIYLICRLAGYGFEKTVLNRVKEAKKLNRLGGAGLGAVKAIAFISIIFFFLALVPRQKVQATVPKLLKSKTYQLAARYNPMGRQDMLERMRTLRTSVKDPKTGRRLRNDPKIQALLKRHGMKDALGDKRFVKTLEEGDFENLRKFEKVEELMKDDQLVELLGKLDKQPSG